METDARQYLYRCIDPRRSVTVTNCLVLATIDLQGFGAHSDAWLPGMGTIIFPHTYGHFGAEPLH